MKKHWVLGLGIVGALLTIQSVFWEYGRMRPDYGFIVDPWSIRGFETVHGSITASIGALALASFLAVAWKGSQRPPVAAAITLFMAVGATVIAAVFGGGDYEITPGFPVIAVLTLILGLVIYRVLGSLLKSTPVFTNAWLRTLLLIILFGAIAVGVNATIGGQTLSMPQWAAIGIVFALLTALSLASEPRELAANRMLMLSSVVGAAAIALSAGAVRSTLVRFQIEAGGVPAQYKDTQVTSGHLLAVVGMVLVFFAAVALWARRRDAILTAARAERQRAAAEASAAEIEAALQHLGQGV